MNVLLQYAAVGGAGAAGAMLRLAINSICGRWFGAAFPVGTVAINVSGSLFLGWFLTLIGQRWPVHETFRLAVAVGFIGAYTTFSTFAWESHTLFENGASFRAFLNLIGSVALGLAAVRCGIWLAGR